MYEDDIFNGLGVEVELPDSEKFLQVKETLTRIGIPSYKTKSLYQTCHILHKRGRYVIIHFKELFRLDGKESEISKDDIDRRDTIAMLLEDWGLVKILDDSYEDKELALDLVKIVRYNDKESWNLVPKYNIGK